jgi:PAS domain S-box-containing protein
MNQSDRVVEEVTADARIRVLVADDHREVREVLAELVDEQSDLELLGAVADHADTVALATRLGPDVVLMDVRMPRGTGPDTVTALHALVPETRVVALSAEEDLSVVVDILAAGAAGYQVKGACETEILDAIRRAARGQLSLPADLAIGGVPALHRGVEDYLRAQDAPRQGRQTMGQLFDRIPASVILVEPNDLITRANARTKELFGFEPSDMVGWPVANLIPDRHRSTLDQLLRRARVEPYETSVPLAARRQDGSEFPVMLTVVPIDAALALFFNDLTQQKSIQDALENSIRTLREIDRQRQSLLTHLVRAQEEERNRIAAGIHDDLIQAITAASLRIQHLRRRMTNPDDRRLLTRLEETMQLAIGHLRHLMFDLRTPDMERGGFTAAVHDALEQLQAETGAAVSMENGLSSELPPETQIIAYRMTQEALTNVRMHAQAHQVAVQMREVNDGLLVTVQDDGVGYDPVAVESQTGHLGLTLLKERAEIAGGWSRVEGVPNVGTRVEFWIPRGEEPLHDDQQGCTTSNRQGGGR